MIGSGASNSTGLKPRAFGSGPEGLAKTTAVEPRNSQQATEVTLCQPTPREVDSMLVHATPPEVNPTRAKSTHGHIVRSKSAGARGPVADFWLDAKSAVWSAHHSKTTCFMKIAHVKLVGECFHRRHAVWDMTRGASPGGDNGLKKAHKPRPLAIRSAIPRRYPKQQKPSP